MIENTKSEIRKVEIQPFFCVNFRKNDIPTVFNLIVVLCFQFTLYCVVKSGFILRGKISNRQVGSASGESNEVVWRYNRGQLFKTTDFAVQEGGLRNSSVNPVLFGLDLQPHIL